ncbi:hypothetical protein ABT316_17270 [Streptomyces cellulosae]
MTPETASVVVIEFGDEQPPRTFDELLPYTTPGRRIRIDPLLHPQLPETFLSVQDQAEHWARKLTQERAPRIAAVLAYCSGSAFASALASAAGDDTTSLLLLDPVTPTREGTQYLFEELVTGMNEGPGRRPVPDIRGLSATDALYTAGLFLREVAASSAPELPDDIIEALTRKQRAWLNYSLSAALVPDAGKEAQHVLLSQVSDDWPTRPGTDIHRFPTDTPGLFRSADAGRLLQDLVTRALGQS